MKTIVVMSTCLQKEEAKKLANILIESKLAVCVQIKKIESVYSWENKIFDEIEYQLLIKTKKANFKKIKRKIKENHSYDLPEIIGINITNISREYKNFIKENTK